MTSLRISELAERSGVPVSTLRYYERIGLLRPVERLGNGYRSFDDNSAEQLSFIVRAKKMGIPLGEVAELIEIWTTSGCRPFQDRIRSFLAQRTSDVEAQLSDLGAFAVQLRALAQRLDGREGSVGLCELDCDCVHLDQADPMATGAGGGGDVIRGCSLEPGQQARRLGAWKALFAAGTIVSRSDGTLKAEFVQEPDLAAEVARLCSLEVGCCSDLAFSVELRADSLVVTVGGSPTTVQEFVRHVLAATVSSSE